MRAAKVKILIIVIVALCLIAPSLTSYGFGGLFTPFNLLIEIVAVALVCAVLGVGRRLPLPME